MSSTDGLTPAERALDNTTSEEEDDNPPAVSSPIKGKRRASNSKNINPKSRASSNAVASPFLAFEDYAKKKDDGQWFIWSNCFQVINDTDLFYILTGKAQLAQSSLGFEKMKYDWLMEKEDKGINLEEKKFTHAKEMESKRWDHSIEIEKRNYNCGIDLEEKKMKWEAEEKEKEQKFEIEKIKAQTSQENQSKKMDLVVKLLDDGKTLEEIERLTKLLT